MKIMILGVGSSGTADTIWADDFLLKTNCKSSAGKQSVDTYRNSRKIADRKI